MRLFKLTYFLLLIMMFSFISSFNILAMQPSYKINFPAYPIYPNESTPIKVNSHEINININNEVLQTATFVNKYTLENTSDDDTSLKFIFPFFGSYNLNILENETTLDYVTYELFNNNFFDKYSEDIDYQSILELINYENYNDIYENKIVNIYKLNKTNYDISLEINYNENSSIIFSSNPYRNLDKNKIGCNCIIEKDIYIIDLNNDIEIKINNVKQQPESYTIFKNALINLIQYSNDNRLDDKTLNHYYNIIIANEPLAKGIFYFNTYYFGQSFQVNQYEILFEPGEIKEISVIYDVLPSRYQTTTDPYYKYALFFNKENWNSYSNLSINVNLNENYKYLKECSFEVIKNENNSYKVIVDENSASKITFGLFTSINDPIRSTGYGNFIVMIILVFLIALALLFIIIIIIIVLIIKNKNESDNRYKKN